MDSAAVKLNSSQFPVEEALTQAPLGFVEDAVIVPDPAAAKTMFAKNRKPIARQAMVKITGRK
jgi:hypothetical protein